MNRWKEIHVDGVSKIERVAAEFVVWSVGKIPGAKFRVKIIEDYSGNFIGISNVRILNHNEQTIDGVAGLGASISETLEDTLKRFFELVTQYENIYGRELEDNDFVWSDPEDF